MAPTKSHLLRSTIATRSKKRKADVSPPKHSNTKRSALGEITNKSVIITATLGTKGTKAQKKTVHTFGKGKQNENLGPPVVPLKPNTRGQLRKDNCSGETLNVARGQSKENVVGKVKTKRLSDEFEKSGESLYCSALEDM